VAARWPGRALTATFADLDSACTRLRRVDGIDTLIVSAHGEAALAAALWCDARRRSVPVDALLLYAPVFGWKLRRGLDITCPVLVLAGGGEEVTRVRGRHRASGFRRRAGGVGKLGPHVTWLRLPDAEASPCARDRRRFFDEMGRWLGAYMYRQMRDQLL
jgi:alpha-beta hydrolase superfamily lysophospholipase